MFLEGNYLAVFGTMFRPKGQLTYVFTYDVSDKRNPRPLKSYGMSGRYIDGRKSKDGFVYLISTHRLV
jgi:hypothetical protein